MTTEELVTSEFFVWCGGHS